MSARATVPAPLTTAAQNRDFNAFGQSIATFDGCHTQAGARSVDATHLLYRLSHGIVVVGYASINRVVADVYTGR